jgi:hypothetical protein
MALYDKLLLRRRVIIETVNNERKNITQSIR